MIRYLLILSTVLLIVSCKKKYSSSDTTDATDSTQVDSNTLVSDVNWGDEEEAIYVEEEPEKKKRTHRSSSNRNHRSGGGGGTADTDVDVIKYKNHTRDGDRPSDFATAIIYPAIRMVYSDNFAKPKATVLNAQKDGERHTIDLAITWKDHWTPKYKIEGTLEVNTDGSDAKFTITNKNTEAEVLELTEDNFQTEITLPSL
ncbi:MULTISPECIES: hypothetical protein [unclassified Aureispira]|uniref:hypothetical protein n=1 Tax=unclassified Aureispira TaxID=2649989 RepID=UPI0006965A20|nr:MULTISPECIES: hypothetical protein [unclassified Aureispira]WMX13514.1 hypothetical protein QP953_21940 [Aureispira sp. CCB-E]